MADIYDNIDEMISLLHKKAELYGQFKRGLRLAALLGMAPRDMTSPVRHSVRDYDQRPLQRWRGMVLGVTYEGNTREFPLKDVHHDLWPADVLAEYRRWEKRNTKPKE
jgi:hypothetical protein